MKIFEKKNVLIIFLFISFSFLVNAQSRKKADKDTEQWRYEIECVGTGVQGTYLIKVWSYSKKPEVATEQAKKNAVHGIIFKGFPGDGKSCNSQKPLARDSNLEKEKESFFKDFFADGGKYMKFVSFSTDGAIDTGDVVKISKKKYKVGVVVSVRKDELRKDLETAEIIPSLGDGF